jgi:hypothetical protein
MLCRDLLDVHAALRREQQQRSLGRGIVEHGGVHLARERHLLLDEKPLHAVLADAHAEDGVGCGPRRLGVVCEPDAAGLAALAGRHLCLDHAGPQLLCGLRRLAGVVREHAPRRVDAGRAQERLGRMLLEVHFASPRSKRHCCHTGACPRYPAIREHWRKLVVGSRRRAPG